MKIRILLSILLLTSFVGQSQDVQTYLFAQRDTQSLYLDVYTPSSTPTACVVFAFGGGFMSGSRNNESTVPYFQTLQQRGYLVVAFDYRLGLKGKHVNSLSIKPVEEAIMLAVEDLYSAVDYLIVHREALQVDTSKIVLMGSSAGAITVLQADYMQSRRMPISHILPENFRFAGVVSFSGAIFSREGKVDYLRRPAPTFFLHGTKDQLVTYKKIQLFNIGFFGSDPLIKRFKKFDYPFMAHRYEGHGHEIAAIMTETLDETLHFIETMVLRGEHRQVDALINDPALPFPKWGNMKPSEMK